MAGEFAGLVESDQIGRVTRGFQEAIAASFMQDKGPQTQNEIKRRFGICERIFRQLRGDLSWSVPRVLDHLPRFLRCELDGAPWKPDATTVWTPD